MMNSEQKPLIVIVGPTASGKTSLGIMLAKQYDGEVISADSRAIYMGMDIGAAKPSVEERQGVSHWGFDLVEPGDEFTAADFKKYAEQKIHEIRARGHVPIVVGGTGLYLDAVLFDFQFGPKPSVEERNKWESYSLEELHLYCVQNNIELPENSQNKRYVINTILRNGHALKRREVPRRDAVIVGITTNKHTLRCRMQDRADDFFNAGVVEEAKLLNARYGWDNQAMTGSIYPLIRRYLAGEIEYEELKRLYAIKEWHLAKRQLTWFRRNEHIIWLPLAEAYTYLAHALDSLNNL